jgi:hypothetical protein
LFATGKPASFLTDSHQTHVMKAVVRFVLRGLAVALVLALHPEAGATPYASGISNISGTISFTLNESADNVTVLFDGGATTLDMGALAAGRHSFPLGSATSFAIRASKSGPAAWTQIGTDSVLTRFFSGTGVAVNTNAASPYFGRVYVANGTPGTTTVGDGPHRLTGDGIYALNADFSDALNQGATARTAGINFAPAAQPGNTPWRIEVGKDDRLYIADYSTTSGTIHRTDPDVTTAEQVLDGLGTTGNPAVHTTIGALRIFGRMEDSDLVVWGIDGNMAGGFNSIKRWTIGAGPLPWATAPDLSGGSVFSSVAQLQHDLDISTDGRFFASVNRFDGTDSESLRVFDVDGTAVLFASRTLAASAGITPDPFRQTRGIRISPDGTFLASITDTNGIVITRLTNGIPDIGAMQIWALFPTNRVGRDVCFDIAGNLYAISSGAEVLRAFSPGGTTTATTASDGTFSLTKVPLPEVSVSTTDSLAGETGPDAGTVTFARLGDATSALTVNLTAGGTATSGADYPALPASVTFLANETTVTLSITPTDDNEAERPETVVVSLAPGDYLIASPSSATVTIVDNEYPNAMSITATDTNIYERTALDTASFTITRLGDTNVELFLELTFTGSAVGDTDYTLPVMPINMPAGVTSLTLSIAPIDDAEYEGDETVTITFPSTPDYVPGTPGSATVKIRENELPAARVLFSDNFDFDTSGEWTAVFGANNNIFDALTTFAYPYSDIGAPPAPGTMDITTSGLYVSVNNDATASAAAMNLYPNGQSFSGNYALRFDAYLNVGTASTTEHMLVGINHSGEKTNRVRLTTVPATTDAPGADGVWFTVVTDASNLRDYAAYSSTNSATLPALLATRTAASMARFLPAPPYRSPGGSPANAAGSSTPTWAEFEVSQFNNVIALKVNGIVAIQITNTTAFTNGNIMIGHCDAFDSTGSATTATIFDNVRVVSLDLAIVNVQVMPANTVQIEFLSPLGGVPGDFVIEGTETLSPPAWNPENGAVVTALPGGAFRAVVPASGNTHFYRVRR